MRQERNFSIPATSVKFDNVALEHLRYSSTILSPIVREQGKAVFIVPEFVAEICKQRTIKRATQRSHEDTL